MNSIDKAVRVLQAAVQKHFGKARLNGCGEGTLYIAPDKIDMTDLEGTIVARGPAQVARVLRRKRRK